MNLKARAGIKFYSHGAHFYLDTSQIPFARHRSQAQASPVGAHDSSPTISWMAPATSSGFSGRTFARSASSSSSEDPSSLSEP